MNKTLLSIIFFSFSLSLFASDIKPKVIYGDDNRQDVYLSKSKSLVRLSRSTAAMISSANIQSITAGEFRITGSTLQSRGICAKERFSEQVASASCSGFLVSPNVIVTAGHCIKNNADCAKYKWVFDFKLSKNRQKNISVPESSVYSCKRVIKSVLDSATSDDYAVIEIDRDVTDRQPLEFRKTGKIAQGHPVAVIGHPTGLPTKITDKANVRSHSEKYFVANLDTYGGNSGSAVFNSKTYKVEGILVRGENDYVADRELGCRVSNVCTNNGCRGEDVTYITNIKELKKL